MTAPQEVPDQSERSEQEEAMMPTRCSIRVSTLACPGCGSTEVSGIQNGLETNVFCRDCASCWHVSLGAVRRVNPATCGSGCSNYERCSIAYAKDAPSERHEIAVA